MVIGLIDCHQPAIEDKLEVSSDINKIVRKIIDNFVNVNHERKAEELSWFYRFPLEVNGLNEDT